MKGKNMAHKGAAANPAGVSQLHSSRPVRRIAELASIDVKKLKLLFQKFKRELQLYRNILADPRTPKLTKWLLGSAVAYAVTPVDILPDFIPVVGHLDDIIIVPALVYLALKTIPKPLLEEHRRALSP
jgi:uncharacterized membrane protein YkvA (DUF1232 family)